MSVPIQTSDATFEEDVLGANRPAVIDFWAEWCGSCQTVEQWMDRLARAYDGRIVVAQVDVERCPQTVADYAVRGVPTILLMRDGKVVHFQREELSEGDLRALVEQHLISE